MTLKERRDAMALSLKWREYMYTQQSFKKGFDEGVMALQEQIDTLYPNLPEFSPDTDYHKQLDEMTERLKLEKCKTEVVEGDRDEWMKRTAILRDELEKLQVALNFYANGWHERKSWLNWFGVKVSNESGEIAKEAIKKLEAKE